jgi:hypothetical protein
MLVAGLVCNLLIRPLADHWFMKPEAVAALQTSQGVAAASPSGSFGIGAGGLTLRAVLIWTFVGVPFWALVAIPIGWGAWITLGNAIVIFR